MKSPIKAVCNYVILHIPDEDLYRKKAGRFDVDVSFNPAAHVKCIGTIVSIPYKQEGYESENIVINFKEGEECLFHYMVTSDQDNLYFIGEFDGMKLYKCDLFNLLATREKGTKEWNMVGGWVLCTGFYDDEVVEVEVNKSKVKVVMSKKVPGLISNVQPERSTKIARLVSIGPNERDMPVLDVEPGDLVVFRDGIDSEMIIDGKTYIYMRQEELYAKYKPEKS